MDGLVGWLDDRVAFDEATALKVGQGRRERERRWVRRGGGQLIDETDGDVLSTVSSDFVLEHMLQNDPTAVLANRHAIRRIIDLYLTARNLADSEDDPEQQARQDGNRDGLAAALRVLAEAYRDMGWPGFDDQWEL